LGVLVKAHIGSGMEIPDLAVIDEGQPVTQRAIDRISRTDRHRHLQRAVEQIDLIQLSQLINLVGRKSALQVRMLLLCSSRERTEGKKDERDDASHAHCVTPVLTPVTFVTDTSIVN